MDSGFGGARSAAATIVTLQVRASLLLYCVTR